MDLGPITWAKPARLESPRTRTWVTCWRTTKNNQTRLIQRGILSELSLKTGKVKPLYLRIKRERSRREGHARECQSTQILKIGWKLPMTTIQTALLTQSVSMINTPIKWILRKVRLSKMRQMLLSKKEVPIFKCKSKAMSSRTKNSKFSHIMMTPLEFKKSLKASLLPQ